MSRKTKTVDDVLRLLRARHLLCSAGCAAGLVWFDILTREPVRGYSNHSMDEAADNAWALLMAEDREEEKVVNL